ncbi:helix-turn-helix domain-containing protein [Algoriphagus sp. C2-6-M1]|uniref:helix-turn-helix domain-containing protein n=1 Tax=Algoriphagus persicinus TaxID=3108754 RepID=UPI002B412925|nr:helix-turn-helix domain-containing protein [Algoriphagus sp. C2-6-M1]
MDNKALGVKLKTLRLKNGFSQDELAESAGVSLRTVQRIENAETIPRGDTVKRLFQIFGMSPDEVLDWSQTEDKGFLMGRNLSGLMFLIFPLLGVMLPLVLWISRKDKIAGVSELGRNLVNFQLTWTLIYYVLVTIYGWSYKYFMLGGNGDISPSSVESIVSFRMGVILTIYLIVSVMIAWNTYRINYGLSVKYFPKINFLR